VIRREFLRLLASLPGPLSLPWEPTFRRAPQSKSMRRILIPIGGKSTDANGNATFDLGLERTGDWRNVKVAASLSGAAEWALVSGGSALTFGRGRRVTLGPELLEPFDTLTLQVAGGPPNQPITGTVSGMAGDQDEISGTFTPAPNTIALDTAPTGVPILPLAGTSLTSGNFVNCQPLPIGTTYVRVWMAPSTPATVQLIGLANPSVFGGLNRIYYQENAPTSTGFYRDVEVDPELELTLRFNNNGAGTINGLVITAHTDPVPPDVFNSQPAIPVNVQPASGADFPVHNTTAAPWQAAASNAGVAATSVNAGASLTLIAAVAGKTVYLHGYSFSQDGANAAAQWQLQDSGGGTIATFFDVAARHVFASGDFRGFPLAAGLGVRITNGGAAASFVGGFLSYTQQ